MDFTTEEVSTLMTTNFESAFHFCQLAYPLHKASGAGSIVFVSSLAGVLSLNVGSIYGSTKGTYLKLLSILNYLEFNPVKVLWWRSVIKFCPIFLNRSNEPIDKGFGL